MHHFCGFVEFEMSFCSKDASSTTRSLRFSPMVRLIRMESIVHVVGSLGLHVDDGIGGGNEAFMNMLFHELKSVSSLGRLKLGNLSTLGYTSNNGMMGA